MKEKENEPKKKEEETKEATQVTTQEKKKKGKLTGDGASCEAGSFIHLK